MTNLNIQDQAGALIGRLAWSHDQLREYQHRRLTELIKHAVSRSPYYRRILGPDPVRDGDVDVTVLPITTKADLMDHFDEVITESDLTRAAAEAHLARQTDELLAGRYRVFATAGSTGRRGVFVYAEDEFSTWVAAQLRMLQVMGVRPGMKIASIGAPSPIHLSRQMFGRLVAEQARLGAAPPAQGTEPPRLAVTTPLGEIVAALNAYQPDVIPTYSTIAAQLADEQLAGRLRITPRIIGTGAEVLTAEMRERIRAAWGIEPAQAYLATEVPLLASARNGRSEMQLWEDLVIVEVVDDHGAAVADGVPGSRVLITNLVNRSQPLIRYELTDSVVIAPDADPDGWPFRRLASVEGRRDDVIEMPGRGGGTIAIAPIRLHQALDGFAEITQYQVIHDHGRLIIRLVAPGEADDLVERVRTSMARQLEQLSAAPRSIMAELTDEIGRESGHAAKLKVIKNLG